MNYAGTPEGGTLQSAWSDSKAPGQSRDIYVQTRPYDF